MDRSIGEKPIKEELSFPIRLSDRLREAVREAKIFQAECAELAKQVDSISQLLRSGPPSASLTPPPKPVHCTSVRSGSLSLLCLTAFKTTSPTAKYVVDQLVRVIKELHCLSMLISAIRLRGGDQIEFDGVPPA
ncbi:unnamed protein product [Camellia sinensis]